MTTIDYSGLQPMYHGLGRYRRTLVGPQIVPIQPAHLDPLRVRTRERDQLKASLDRALSRIRSLEAARS